MPRGTKDIVRKKTNTGSQGKNKEDLIHKTLTNSGFRVMREVNIQNAKFTQKFKEHFKIHDNLMNECIIDWYIKPDRTWQ